jgi:hypothetical protein
MLYFLELKMLISCQEYLDLLLSGYSAATFNHSILVNMIEFYLSAYKLMNVDYNNKTHTTWNTYKNIHGVIFHRSKLRYISLNISLLLAIVRPFPQWLFDTPLQLPQRVTRGRSYLRFGRTCTHRLTYGGEYDSMDLRQI